MNILCTQVNNSVMSVCKKYFWHWYNINHCNCVGIYIFNGVGGDKDLYKIGFVGRSEGSCFMKRFKNHKRHFRWNKFPPTILYVMCFDEIRWNVEREEGNLHNLLNDKKILNYKLPWEEKTDTEIFKLSPKRMEFLIMIKFARNIREKENEERSEFQKQIGDIKWWSTLKSIGLLLTICSTSLLLYDKIVNIDDEKSDEQIIDINDEKPND